MSLVSFAASLGVFAASVASASTPNSAPFSAPLPASHVAVAADAKLQEPQEKSKPKPKPEEQPVYDEKADANVDVAAAVARAKKENKRVLIQWGANWCGWCKWLSATMKADKDLQRKILYEYEVVHVDVGRFDKHKELAQTLGAEFKSIPYLTILGADGKAIIQQNTEPFEAKIDGKDGHDPKKLLEFLTTHQAKPLEAAAVLAAGLETAKKEQKKVFLHFGAPWCGWCHRLEGWMAQPEIAAVLGKDFVDVKIDNDRMTGGKAVYEARIEEAGQKPGGIPWFVFLDENGKLLAHSNGPKGNTGFPYEIHEVEHFVAMLNAVKKNLTDADVKLLSDSLNANREKDKARTTVDR